MENVSMDANQCFKILEIQETDSLDEIKQAYRDLIAIWHPDRYTQNSRLQQKATEKVKELNGAYQYLVFHISQIKATAADKTEAVADPLQPLVVICPKCRTMNRFQRNSWVRQRKCIHCNYPLLNADKVFDQKTAPWEAKKGPTAGEEKKRRRNFRWILLCAAAGIGVFYLVAAHVKPAVSPHFKDKNKTGHTVQTAGAHVGKERIMEIQGALRQLGYDPGPQDGVLGDQTLNAVSRFKVDYSILSSGIDDHLLMAALVRHTGIGRLHQDWPVISRNNALERWMEEQTITSPKVCKQILASGSIAQVASLLDWYKFDRIRPNPLSLPPSGVIHKSYVKGFAPLTIQSQHEGRHYFVKLIRESDQSEAFSAFLRSGFTLTEHVPVGRYRLKYALGQTWYGTKWLFGSETVFQSMDQVFDFKFQGNEIKGYRLNLYLSPLSASQAPKTYAFDF
jgi:hypothetical protein